jgi:conjugal transfer pilus assembly protein TraB
MHNEIKNKQTRRLSILVLLFVVIVGSVSYYIVREEFSPKPVITSTVLPLDRSSPQELWMRRLESEKEISDQKMKYLEEIVLESKKNEGEKELENHLLREEIAKFKQELQKISERSLIRSTQAVAETTYYNDPFSSSEDNMLLKTRQRAPLTELIVADPPAEKMLHVDQAIPAGTSVKAILVSSVDMPCGVFNSTDPQPIKLRLVDDGRLPKKVRARLKGGIIIASAYGDLSNERIYIRIERLTQVRADGKFIESGVAGYVTGEDGKYGLKGVVVDKSYKMVENAAISGFFSGVNQYLQANAAKNCNFYEGAGVLNGADLATTGALGGTNGAFDMLTNYYIKRAEQIRPVIEASAGRIVDVTFIHSAELGDLHIKEKVKRIRDLNRET